MRLSDFSTGDICVLAKPVPGDEKAGELVANYCPGLCDVTCGGTKGTVGLFVPWCHIRMKVRQILPLILWVGNWVLRSGGRRAVRD